MGKFILFLLLFAAIIGGGYYFFEVAPNAPIAGSTYNYVAGGISFKVVYPSSSARTSTGPVKPTQGHIYANGKPIGMVFFQYYDANKRAVANFYTMGDSKSKRREVASSTYATSTTGFSYLDSKINTTSTSSKSKATTLPATSQLARLGDVQATQKLLNPPLAAAPLVALSNLMPTGLGSFSKSFIGILIGAGVGLFVILLMVVLAQMFKGTGMNNKQANAAAAATILGVLAAGAAAASEANKKSAQRSQTSYTPPSYKPPRPTTNYTATSVKRSVNYTTQTCSACRGRGQVSEKCGACNGSGSIKYQYGGHSNTSDVFMQEKDCTSCRGSGTHSVQCHRCNGQGSVRVREED